jgi:hypothetical protein
MTLRCSSQNCVRTNDKADERCDQSGSEAHRIFLSMFVLLTTGELIALTPYLKATF